MFPQVSTQLFGKTGLLQTPLLVLLREGTLPTTVFAVHVHPSLSCSQFVCVEKREVGSGAGISFQRCESFYCAVRPRHGKILHVEFQVKIQLLGIRMSLVIEIVTLECFVESLGHGIGEGNIF